VRGKARHREEVAMQSGGARRVGFQAAVRKGKRAKFGCGRKRRRVKADE